MSNTFTKHTDRQNLTLCSDAEQASIYTARQIADVILEKQKQGERAILGLATGKTPIKVYQELIRLHKTEKLSFHNVISFNLDEYYPIDRKSTRLNSSHVKSSYAVFCLKNKINHN